MLVLSRRIDQSIVITVPPSDQPTELRVLVNSVSVGQGGRQVCLCFEAPRDVSIFRSEVLERQEPHARATIEPQPQRRAV